MTGRDPLTGLPRIAYARLPTPLDPAPRLAAALGLGRLDVKREDLSGDALGGNKLRQLDFILAAAMEAGADAIVTTAGAQSNFCRALAGACARLGLECHLLLRGGPGQAASGNLLLDQLFGAVITWTELSDPWDPAIAAQLNAIAARLRGGGHHPNVVQLPGATAGLGAAGWVGGAAELAADWDARGIEPDAVVVACGSGLTLAGLALGLKHAGHRCRAVGISVQQPAGRLLPWVVEAGNRAAVLADLSTRLATTDLLITDDQVAPGYGRPSAASIEAVRLAGREAGLLLDPVYSGKALAGLISCVEAGHIRRGATVTLLHSGGTPGLFHHAGALAPAP